MQAFRQLQNQLVRLALVAMVALALAPTVSRAIAASWQVGAWVEICTSLGTRWVSLADASDPEGSGSSPGASSSEPCAFCLLSTDRWAPPGPTPKHLTVEAAGSMALPVWQAFFFLDNRFIAACPRGPPQDSDLS